MWATRTLGITAIAAALGGTVIIGAQAVTAGQHLGTAHTAAASITATAGPANDPWD